MTRTSRFPVPEIADLPDDLRERVVEVQEKVGFVPNVFLALAHRPDELRTFLAYHDALMEKSEGLSKAEREMIVVATSGLNHCQYCVIAHGAILRIRSKNPRLAEQVAVDYRSAEIDARQRAMLAFALKVAGPDSADVDEADFERLRAAGFDDEAIWDIGSIAAFFAMSNRLAALIGMQANREFYALGR